MPGLALPALVNISAAEGPSLTRVQSTLVSLRGRQGSQRARLRHCRAPRAAASTWAPWRNPGLGIMAGAQAAQPQKRYYRQRAHSNPIADHTLR